MKIFFHYNYSHQNLSILLNISRSTTKQTKWIVRPVKTQISRGICPVWSESSLCTFWVTKGQNLLQVDSEHSDQTWMPSLILVFVGCSGNFVVFVVLRSNSVGQVNEKAWAAKNFRTSLKMCVWKLLRDEYTRQKKTDRLPQTGQYLSC